MGTDPFEGMLIGGRYRIVRPLGRGGMGAVYEAVQVQLNRRVAVKLLVEVDARGLSRFRQEALAAASVHHPNVAQVTDFIVEDDGPPALVVELLEGETLRDLLGREGRLAPARAVRIAQQMLAALEAAHALGIIHRDVKPANVFLVRVPQSPDFVKLLDFGIAKFIDDAGGHKTTVGQMVGTPAYMAPEQVDRRPPDARTDVHAVGVCLFEMLTGERAFGGGDLSSIVGSVRSHRPRRVAEVPSALADVVARALAKDPFGRFASANEMSAALSASLNGVRDDAPDTVGEAPDTIVEATPIARQAPRPAAHEAPFAPRSAVTPPKPGALAMVLSVVAFGVALVAAAIFIFVTKLPRTSPPAASAPDAAPTPVGDPPVAPPPTEVVPLAGSAECRCVAGVTLCPDTPPSRCIGTQGTLCEEPFVDGECRVTDAKRPGKKTGDECEGWLHPQMAALLKTERGKGKVYASGCPVDSVRRIPVPRAVETCEAFDVQTLERRRGTWKCGPVFETPAPAVAPVAPKKAASTSTASVDRGETAPCRCDSGGQGTICLDYPKCSCIGGPNGGSLCTTPAEKSANGGMRCASTERTYPGKRVGDACEGFYLQTPAQGTIRWCDRMCESLVTKPKSIIGTPCEGVHADTNERRQGTWKCM